MAEDQELQTTQRFSPALEFDPVGGGTTYRCYEFNVSTV